FRVHDTRSACAAQRCADVIWLAMAPDGRLRGSFDMGGFVSIHFTATVLKHRRQRLGALLTIALLAFAIPLRAESPTTAATVLRTPDGAIQMSLPDGWHDEEKHWGERGGLAASHYGKRAYVFV